MGDDAVLMAYRNMLPHATSHRLDYFCADAGVVTAAQAGDGVGEARVDRISLDKILI